ncbi:hypothetical protein [Streptomyces sp. NPDC102437]|uniref:hypothetical protein n=1 Tax=Streptomyces sp. NPDC102437 TaxID=3366175 RepID=UPI0037F39770
MPVEPLPCAAPEPEPPTPPCCSPGLASTGLCLANGTPIAVLAVTACEDCGATAAAPTQTGWMNLLNGQFAAGPPPAGTEACAGQPAQFEVGQWCDLDAEGEVIAPVLVEYEYDEDGQLIGVRTLTPAGDPYTVTGTLGICPGPVDDVEYLVLCDVQPDGTAIEFLRALTPNGDDTSTARDTTLDGTAPYTPTGTVGVCHPPQCRHCESSVLCDVPASTVTALLLNPPSPPALARSGTLPNGVGWEVYGGSSSIANWWSIALLPSPSSGPLPVTFTQPVEAEWSAQVGRRSGGVGVIVMPPGTQLVSLDPTHLWDPATRNLSPVATAGPVGAGAPVSRFRHPGPVTELRFATDGATGFSTTQRMVGDFLITPATRAFLRTVCRDCDGQVLDTTDTHLDGTTPYTVTGQAGVCHPPTEEPCASTVDILRLCDLNPTVEPDPETGLRCAVPFLRHLVHDCSGALVETRDTTVDSSTPYTPVQVTDCGSGLPALAELLWPQTGIAEDPAGVARQDFIYTITNPQTDETAHVHLHASSTSPGGCGTYDPANPVFNNPTVYTLTLDAAAQEMSVFRLDLLDFDTFEGVTQLSPIPSRVEGDVTWNGSTITANTSNAPAYVYWDQPPATISYRYGNTGGGLACSAVAFQGMTLIPEGCCGCDAAEPCRDTATLLLCDETSDVTWTQTAVAADPNSPPDQGWVFTLTAADDPAQVAKVRVTTSQRPAASCAASGPRWYGGGTTLTYELDEVAQTFPTLRVNVLDFDRPEYLTMQGSATPDRLGGSATTTGNGVIHSNLDNSTGYLYFDGPPAKFAYTFTGACTSISFDAISTRTTQFLRKIVTDCETGTTVSVVDSLLDGTPYEATGDVGQCQSTGGGTSPEPCRDTSSTLLCDTAATDVITVFDPATRPDADGWDVVSFTGAKPDAPPEAPLPYPARYATVSGMPVLGARADANAGYGGGGWTGYDLAPVRWVLRKTFQAPEDGVAVAQSVGFRGDGGARVRINGADCGLYGQWNQPATSGTAQIPVTAGPNTVEIEVRDTNGLNYVTGRLDLALPKTTQFMRRQVVDCETGEVIATHDTTLDGDPYTVVGEVGECQPVAECCEQPPPETRVDVETQLLCVRDQTSGDITGKVIAERVYDDQTGGLVEQRLTDLAGDPYTLPAGAELVTCPSSDRITRQVCVVESGRSEFLTNAANATAGVDTDWQWAPNLNGVWHPMYRVAPNALWTATDTAPNKAHWVGPHSNRTVCPAAGENSPPVPGTWYTRASWNLPADVNPETIRIAATVLNADNKVVQWRLNDGAWQPVGGGTLANPPWTFPPTAVPGGRAGQNEVVVQILETQPAVNCPSANEAGMLLHVIATYDHEPQVWTQIIEPGGQTYYLDENGDRQNSIPAGKRLVACGGGGDAPCCPAVNTDTVTLCDTAPDGTVTEFLRHLTYTEGVDAPAVVDTGLDGTTPYSASGRVGLCQQQTEDCRNGSTLLLCDVPTDGAPAATITDTAPAPYYPFPTGMPMAGAQALWDGSTLTVPPGSGPQPGTTGTVRTMAASIQAPRPGCDTGTARVTVSVDAEQLGPDAGCAVTGHLRLFNGTTPLATALPANNTPVGWSGTLTVEADAPAADVAAGNLAVLLALDVYDDSPAVCPGSPRETSWQLSRFTTSVLYEQTGCAEQFLRTVTTDCETGAVTATSDTTLDGQPYTVTGEPGQCDAGGGSCCPERPCGDTEVLQLCDLTYDPQAPIPTPARDFALTGNVVAGNNGTTLWFAQANQEANGVAELTVGGLLPAVRYEYRFASAWIGAGNPTPATNNAIYLLEILDGTTVLANRTRNVSNGSNVFPGGTLSEDLPPVAFTAPPTGAVTIRLTDQTTGGPFNDRDLFLMPFEVRTETLTLTRTPFLRRFTYACDGSLTSAQDLALDGITPYEVQGEASHCTGGDGGTTSAAPCDVQNVIQECRCDDTDGDGEADTDYVELLGVDCDGQLSSIGTYTADLSAPYSPVAPIDCRTGEAGPPSATGAQAHRVELTAGQTWDASAWPTLQSVTAVARGVGTVTTTDGVSTLVAGESVTWSVARDSDASLTGPLTIAATDGTVTVAFTTAITL